MPAPDYQLQWYSRRSGVVRGPFSAEEISRHLILGRLCKDDEISQDRVAWEPAEQVGGLLPAELQNLDTWDDYQRLVIARMQVDERKAERRCQDCNNRNNCHPERRSNTDRRNRDNDQLVSHYLFGHAGRHSAGEAGGTRPILLALLLMTVIFAWLVPTQR